MNARPGTLTRQQLYDRIRESSKDEVVLDEMIRLGFWPDGAAQPNPPGELIRRRGEIERELTDLHRTEARWRDPESAIKEMHKLRKKAALERRKETRRRNAQARHDGALTWHARRRDEILYLGEAVSGGLGPAGAPAGTLKPGLPEIASVKALAEAMGVAVAELRFLAFDRALSRVSHYKRFTLPKKTGGLREISAPMPRLKRAQYWILDNLLARAPLHEAAHGFVPGRSIVTNAAAHVGRDVVVNLDLKDFFPSLTYRRVKGKFRGLGYSEQVATVLALIATEPDVDEIEIDGERLYAARGPRRLPQGAPTSPALTNLVCARLDARLSGLAASLGFAYTRYADDMTFSASGEAAGKVGPLLKYAGEIVAAEGFTVHPDKTRVMRRGGHQEVTGLTVNERVAVPRQTLRRFRALLHRIGETGPAGKRWGAARDVFDGALGFAFFVRMVTPELGEKLVTEVRGLAARHGKSPAPPASRRPSFRAASARPELGLPLDRWWTPAETAPPVPEPILTEPAAPPPRQSVRGSALSGIGMRRRQAPAPEAQAASETGGMPWWAKLIGVFVLINVGLRLHPALGLLVLLVASVFGFRAAWRFLNRRR